MANHLTNTMPLSVCTVQFLGNKGLAYGGTLTFTLSSFSGDFSSGQLNDGVSKDRFYRISVSWPVLTSVVFFFQAYLVYLECSKCNSNTGVRLGFPLSAIKGGFTGKDKLFSISLNERAGWLEDTKNTLQVGGVG